jgi:HlyD family secretion protein
MRRVRVAVVVAVVAVAAWLVFARTRGDSADERWVTAAVDRGPIAAGVTATGTVSPVASVQVGTYVSGPIQEIHADFNTPVHRGQLLARIDPRPFTVKVEAARADLTNARAKLEKDQADAALKAATVRRVRELAAGGIVAASELDLAVSDDRQARAQVALSEAAIVSAQARLREAEVSLAYTDIVSPVDGVVVSRNVDKGQTVAATFQTPTLFLVAEDLTKMQVSASVSESDIGSVAAGQEARFSVDAYPGTTFEGRVAQVRNAPVALQNVVTYDVIVNVDNAELRLKPGMTANVSIVTASRDDALRVPTSALRFRPPADSGGRGAAAAGGPATGSRVWVLDPAGGLHAVPVTTGISDDRFTEISGGGIEPGQHVVVALHREPAVPTPARGPSFGGGGRRGR